MSIDIEKLELKAKKLRRETIDLSLKTGLAHLGGSLSEIELLTTLYSGVLKDEDQFILSKGHACLPWYILLMEKGFRPELTGHPEIDPSNGIICSTGSLGHGYPIAAGMAYARKRMGKKGKTYVLMSDGECQEGSVWETADIASSLRLDNLVAIVDYNKIQALSRISDVRPNFNLTKRFEAFGCEVREIDGHSFSQIHDAFNASTDRPYVIVANTIKGKGVSYMENDPIWHAKKPDILSLERAYGELT